MTPTLTLEEAIAIRRMHRALGLAAVLREREIPVDQMTDASWTLAARLAWPNEKYSPSAVTRAVVVELLRESA